MPFGPDRLSNATEDLRRTFNELSDDIAIQIAKQVNKQKNADFLKAKQNDIIKLRNLIDKEIIKMSQLAQAEVEDIIGMSFDLGTSDADSVFELANKRGFSFAAGLNQDDFKTLNAKRVGLTVDNIMKDINKQLKVFGKRSVKEYKGIINKANLDITTGNKTSQKAISDAVDKFLSKGINSVTYGKGSKKYQVNIGSWVETKVRTEALETSREANSLRTLDYGWGLVIISQHANSSSLCEPWQGRVYALNKKASNTYGYILLSIARDGGLFHPNCKHNQSTFIPGVTTVPDRLLDEEQIKKNYNLSQKQRYNERKIREWKRRKEGATTPEIANAAGIKVQQWQASQRTLINNNPDMRRNYSREQIK